MKQMKMTPKSLEYFMVRSKESPTISSFKSLWRNTRFIIFRLRNWRTGKKIMIKMWGKKAWIRVKSWIFDPTLWYHKRLKSLGKFSRLLHNFTKCHLSSLPGERVEYAGNEKRDESHGDEVEDVCVDKRYDEGCVDECRDEQVVEERQRLLGPGVVSPVVLNGLEKLLQTEVDCVNDDCTNETDEILQKTFLQLFLTLDFRLLDQLVNRLYF